MAHVRVRRGVADQLRADLEDLAVRAEPRGLAADDRRAVEDAQPVVGAESRRNRTRHHRRKVGADGDQLAVAVGEAVALLRRVAFRHARIRFREVDDRQHDLGEAGVLEQRNESRLDASPPRRLFDEQRPRACWISEFRRHKVKNLFGSGRGSRLGAAHRDVPLPFGGAQMHCTPTDDDGGGDGAGVRERWSCCRRLAHERPGASSNLFSVPSVPCVSVVNTQRPSHTQAVSCERPRSALRRTFVFTTETQRHRGDGEFFSEDDAGTGEGRR